MTAYIKEPNSLVETYLCWAKALRLISSQDYSGGPGDLLRSKLSSIWQSLNENEQLAVKHFFQKRDEQERADALNGKS